MEDLLGKNYSDQINYPLLMRRREDAQRVESHQCDNYREHIAVLPSPERVSSGIVVRDGVVEIAREIILSGNAQQTVQKAIEAFFPWRKGPFRFFGEYIDAEWRSDFKWSRMKKLLPDLTGKRVLDIGCSNGYYMFRLSERDPELVLGIDPSDRFYYTFQMFQQYVRDPRLLFERLGVEDVPLFPDFFDLTLCMGIIYHRRDPLEMLRAVRDSMRPGGKLIIETQTIPGADPVALFVPDRYAKSRNTFFIPTRSCLEAWLDRSGFVAIEVGPGVVTTVEEQRATRLAPYESLSDFLDPNDSSRTIEGFPAPQRVIATAVRPV